MKKILFLNLRNHGAQEETSGLRETLPQMDLTGLRRGDSVPENLSHDMDLLWARYIAFCLDGDNSFPVTGNEYETLLRRRHGDPRAGVRPHAAPGDAGRPRLLQSGGAAPGSFAASGQLTAFFYAPFLFCSFLKE